MEDKRTRFGWAVVVLSLVALPFFVVRFPPITDLPQHAAQARLLGEVFSDPNTPYAIQWLTPYAAATWLVGLCWALVGPLHAGRLAALLLALSWVAAVLWFARRRGKPIEVAVLAALLVFNHTLYWGFFSFQLGLPLFLLFIEFERRARAAPLRWPWALGLLGFMAALYFTHVLWWAMAGAWLAAAGFLGRLPWREQAKRLVSLVPFALLAAWWFPQLKERGFTSAVFWDRPGLHRLVPAEFVGSVLGGIRGSTEPIVVSCLLVWLAAGVWGSRRRWREVGHADLGIAALVFLLAAIALPYKVENTIRFGQRWMPIAALFAVLYIPPPRIAVRLRLLVAVALLAGLIAATALTWTTFERVELDGLAEALEALPDGQRVLGLNYAWESPRIAGHPYIQTFAYAQVRHGGSLNFSFADFAPCLVVYRVPRPRPWTNALEWLPREVRQGDFGLFDYVLIHGNESEHAVTSERAPIEAVSRAAPWRLYRVERARNASQR